MTHRVQSDTYGFSSMVFLKWDPIQKHVYNISPQILYEWQRSMFEKNILKCLQKLLLLRKSFPSPQLQELFDKIIETHRNPRQTTQKTFHSSA